VLSGIQRLIPAGACVSRNVIYALRSVYWKSQRNGKHSCFVFWDTEFPAPVNVLIISSSLFIVTFSHSLQEQFTETGHNHFSPHYSEILLLPSPCGAEMHKSWAPGCPDRAHFVPWRLTFVGAQYGLATCHHFGIQNFEVALRFLENLYNPVVWGYLYINSTRYLWTGTWISVWCGMIYKFWFFLLSWWWHSSYVYWDMMRY